jgi:hypothetical protein
MLLQRCEGGVDAALQYAKNMAKYMKDLIGYLEKRTTLGKSQDEVGPGGGGGVRRALHLTPHFIPAEMEFAKGLQKVVHNCRQSVTHEVGPDSPLTGSPKSWVTGRSPGLPLST